MVFTRRSVPDNDAKSHPTASTSLAERVSTRNKKYCYDWFSGNGDFPEEIFCVGCRRFVDLKKLRPGIDRSKFKGRDYVCFQPWKREEKEVISITRRTWLNDWTAALEKENISRHGLVEQSAHIPSVGYKRVNNKKRKGMTIVSPIGRLKHVDPVTSTITKIDVYIEKQPLEPTYIQSIPTQVNINNEISSLPVQENQFDENSNNNIATNNMTPHNLPISIATPEPLPTGMATGNVPNNSANMSDFGSNIPQTQPQAPSTQQIDVLNHHPAVIQKSCEI